MGWGGSEGMTFPTEAEIRSWPAPNFVNPVTRKWAVIGVEAPLTLLAVGFVAARFYSRTYIKHVLGWDDWLMLAAMIFSVVITILHCLSTEYATGLHAWDIKYAWTSVTGRLSYTTMVLFAPAASLAKISLCITYLRILPSFSDRLFARLAIVFSICYAVSITSVMVFQCWPISSYWDIDIRTYKCVDEREFNYAASALNTFSDFLIFLWPIRTLWTVRVPIKRRLGLVFIFSVGALVCIAGVFRIIYLYRYFHTYDIYWEGSVLFILACIETNVGIICGCLPGIKPLINRLFPHSFGTTTDYDNPTFSTHARLPGQRLTIQEPEDQTIIYQKQQSLSQRPSSASMIEVPVKLDATWAHEAAMDVDEPEQAHVRVMSDPGLLERQQAGLLGVKDPHPGRRVSGFSNV